MTDLVTPILYLVGIAAAFTFAWLWQLQRGRRRLRERTHIIVGTLVKLIAGHYHVQAPNLARLLASKYWGLWRIEEGTLFEPHFAATLDALEVHFALTFDGQRYHAPGPPRKPRVPAPEEEESHAD